MLWIIEPHSDDVYLGLHAHIMEIWKDRPKTIVTVYADSAREKEAGSYATLVGAAHLCLRCEEGGGLSHPAGPLPAGPPSGWGMDLRRGDVLILPVGLQHPEHRAVRGVLEELPPGGPMVRYYLDTPYYAKQKVREEMNEAIRGMVVCSLIYASVTKWNHIGLFKSQGRYFFHHPPADLPRVEMVLTAPR